MKIYTLTICDLDGMGFGCPYVYNFTDNGMAFKKMEELFIEHAKKCKISKDEIDLAMDSENHNETSHGLAFGNNYCYFSGSWYGDIVEVELNEEHYDEETERIKSLIKSVFIGGQFDGWDIEVKNGDIDTYTGLQLIYISDRKNADHNYAIIKQGDKSLKGNEFLFIPYLADGDIDAYPAEIDEIHNYAYTKYDKDFNCIDTIGFDNMLTEIDEGTAKLLWVYEHKLGKEYMPNRFYKDNAAYEHLTVENCIQEFTVCCYEKFKDHIMIREIFFDWVKEMVKRFVNIYDCTLFCEKTLSYYECVDNFIEKNSRDADEEEWWCK